MNNRQHQPEHPKMSLCDDLLSRAKEGQPAILEDMLKAGIPLSFRDDDGNLMQKNPDGTIQPLQKNEKK